MEIRMADGTGDKKGEGALPAAAQRALAEAEERRKIARLFSISALPVPGKPTDV